MRKQYSPWPLAFAGTTLLLTAGLLIWTAAASAQESVPCVLSPPVKACVHLHDDSQLLPAISPTPGISPAPKRLPVLFVHGHNFGNPNDEDFNYQKNWQDVSVPSFKQAFELNENGGLDIEDYYIRFRDQSRSIHEDAIEIGDAVDLILNRHDPSYAYPHVDGQTTDVKVVIIAYSKGTLSSRLYLKSLQQDIAGLTQLRRSFNPVSEFIALAPPNHGIKTVAAIFTCSGRQMMNGKTTSNNPAFDCNDFVSSLNEPCASPFPAGGLNFISDLNSGNEAPGSRPALNRLGKPTHPAEGTLYVTIFANQNRDFVGGIDDPGECDGRPWAKNLSGNAINIQEAIAGGNDAVVVHGNTPHTVEVICKALFAAVHHRSPELAQCAPASNGLPIIPLPQRAAAVLTLDFSGSMSAPVTSNANRAAVLKQAVELFVQLWSAVSVPTDRIGATYFRSTVDQFQQPGTGELLPTLSAGGSNVIESVSNQQPGNSTAMGAGLQRSIDALNSANSPAIEFPVRRVILFTDGMQNVAPMVTINQSGQLIIDNAGSDTVLDNQLGAAAGRPPIAIDTIGIGAGPAFVRRLQEIALATNGRSQSTTDMTLLRQFFIEELVNALRGFSPQLVAYRRGSLTAPETSETFAIEGGVRKLILKVSWQPGNSLNFSVLRNGADVTKAGRFIDGAFYKIFVINLPANESGADWAIQIKGKPGTTYETAAIVDDSHLTYDANFGVPGLGSGELLELSGRIRMAGRNLSDVTISIELVSPGSSAGDVVAQNPATELPNFEVGSSMSERQLLALALDAKRLKLLKPRRDKLILKANAKGEFKAQIPTLAPGIHTAFITITGVAAPLGRFSRTQTITTVVPFGKADAKATGLFATECLSAGRRYLRILLAPRDRRGRLMGPGLPMNISTAISAGRIVGDVRDFGDGTYAQLLELPPAADPTLRINVAGGEIFNGSITGLLRKSGQ